jgi:hypothetical protein
MLKSLKKPKPNIKRARQRRFAIHEAATYRMAKVRLKISQTKIENQRPPKPKFEVEETQEETGLVNSACDKQDV